MWKVAWWEIRKISETWLGMLPGGFKMVNAIKSVAATVIVPLSLAALITLLKSQILPSVSGYWKITPDMSFLEKSVSKTFCTSILISNGSALVCTQLMVWGCNLSERTNRFRLFNLWRGCVLEFEMFRGQCTYRKQSPRASAAEVPSSRSEALATSSPVRSATIVW